MRKLLVVFLLLIYSTCHSQSSIIVPTAAGGAVDTLARKFAQFVESKTNKSTVIENFPGAGGNIGIAKFLKSRSNTLMITSGSWFISINQGAFNLEDFIPVAILGAASSAVNPAADIGVSSRSPVIAASPAPQSPALNSEAKISCSADND